MRVVGEVATSGWVEGTGLDLVEVVRRFDDPAIAALVVTSIAHDATFRGPDLEQLGLVLEATSVPVIASGGVGTLDDLRELASLRASREAVRRARSSARPSTSATSPWPRRSLPRAGSREGYGR